MFDSCSADMASDLDEPLAIDFNYWDSPQRFADDEDDSCVDDERLDKLNDKEKCDHEN